MQKKLLPFEIFLSDVMLIRENDNMFFFFVVIAARRLLTGNDHNDCGVSWDKKKNPENSFDIDALYCRVEYCNMKYRNYLMFAK